MTDVEKGRPKVQITPLVGEIVKANNAVIDAKQRGGEETHVEAIKRLAGILADNPGAVEIFKAFHE